MTPGALQEDWGSIFSMAQRFCEVFLCNLPTLWSKCPLSMYECILARCSLWKQLCRVLAGRVGSIDLQIQHKLIHWLSIIQQTRQTQQQNRSPRRMRCILPWPRYIRWEEECNATYFLRRAKSRSASSHLPNLRDNFARCTRAPSFLGFNFKAAFKSERASLKRCWRK